MRKVRVESEMFYIWLAFFMLITTAVLLPLWYTGKLNWGQIIEGLLISVGLNGICSVILGLGLEDGGFSVQTLVVYFMANFVGVLFLKHILKNQREDFDKVRIAKYLTFLTPIILFCLIELIFSNISGFSMMKLQYKIVNMIILYAIFAALFYGFFPGRITIVLYTFIGVAYSTVNFYVSGFRNGNAILPAEIYAIRTALNVSSNYSVDWINHVSVLLLGTSIFWGVIFYLPDAGQYYKGKVLKRVCGGIIVIAMLVLGYQGIDLVDKLHIDLNYWEIRESYTEYGTPLTFLALCQKMSVEEPQGYDAEAAEEIAEEYKELAQDQSRTDYSGVL